MARTIRDIPVYNRTVPEVMNEIMAWVNAHKMKIEDNRGTYLKVKMRKSSIEYAASLWMSNQKIIEINVQETPNGIVVHTEGYVKLPLGGGEKDFSANAMNARVPRKEGWRTIEELWQKLSTISGAATQKTTNAPPPPPQYQQPSYPPPPPPQYQQPQSPQQKEAPPPPPASPKAKDRRKETQTPSKIPKFCAFCGTSLGERAEKTKFCPNCGEKIA